MGSGEKLVLKKSHPWTGRLFVSHHLPRPPSAARERDGEDQGYAGKLSFFPFRTARRERGGHHHGAARRDALPHPEPDAGLDREARRAGPGPRIINWGNGPEFLRGGAQGP